MYDGYKILIFVFVGWYSSCNLLQREFIMIFEQNGNDLVFFNFEIKIYIRK